MLGQTERSSSLWLYYRSPGRETELPIKFIASYFLRILDYVPHNQLCKERRNEGDNEASL